MRWDATPPALGDTARKSSLLAQDYLGKQRYAQ